MHPSWRQGCGKINKRFFFGLTFTINFGTKFFCFFAKAFFCFSFFWNRAVSPPSSQSCKYTSIVWVERTVLPSMVCVFDPSVCLSMQPPVEYSKNRNHGMAKKGSPSRRNAPSNPLPTHPFSVCLPCSWGFPPHSLKNKSNLFFLSIAGAVFFGLAPTIPWNKRDLLFLSIAGARVFG